MPDISMCNDYSCPDFDRCYRAQAKPSMRQSYFIGSPRDKEGCDYFDPLETNGEYYASRLRHRNKPSTRQDSCGSDEEH
jgi:hypothetical protein